MDDGHYNAGKLFFADFRANVTGCRFSLKTFRFAAFGRERFHQYGIHFCLKGARSLCTYLCLAN